MKNVIREEIAMLQACKTQKEKNSLIAALKKKHQNDERDTVVKHLKQLKEIVKEVRVETKLLALPEFLVS